METGISYQIKQTYLASAVKMFQTLDKQLRLNLLILFTAGLLFWCSIGSLLPTLPLYIEEVGATKQQIGIVMGSFAIGMLLFRGWMGRLSDRRGRKIALLIGSFVVAIAPLGYLGVQSVPLLMGLRAFHGISIAAFTTAYLALVVDLTPANIRGEVIGYMSLITPLGVAIGPTVGGYLQAGAGYGAVFLASSVSGIVAFLCILFIISPPLPSQPANQKQTRFWQILVSPRVRIPSLVMFLVGLDFGIVHTFIPLFIKSTGVDLNAGLFYGIAASAGFSARFFSGRASDKLGRGLFVTVSLVVYGLGMFFLWQATDKNTFLLGAILEGAGSGIVIPMIAAMMSDRSQAHERGQIFAVCIMGLDLGIAIAGPLIGYIAEEYGYRNTFGLATFLTLCATVIFLTLSSKGIENSLRFATGRGEDVYALERLALLNSGMGVSHAESQRRRE
ncbi:MAG: MFS transporter [Calothrix sp. MO_192.B10]|nr:MFS transporter [Calothrix sp. MO_192.B10]